MLRTISSILIVFSTAVNPLPEQREVRIAILDTGVDMNDSDLKFCPGLSRDFTGTSLTDTHGHGTNIAYIIRHFAQERPYCLIIVKVLRVEKDHNNIQYLIDGLNYIANLKPDIVNASLSGEGSIKPERMAIDRILANNHTIFVAAAGNEGYDLDKNCNIFPACYSNKIVSVGNLGRDGQRNPSSNYGKYVKRWEMGTGILAGGYRMTGSSQASAIASGKLAQEMK